VRRNSGPYAEVFDLSNGNNVTIRNNDNEIEYSSGTVASENSERYPQHSNASVF
jgi:hypothetical protein